MAVFLDVGCPDGSWSPPSGLWAAVRTGWCVPQGGRLTHGRGIGDPVVVSGWDAAGL